ncbi:FIVAR domain-containing protein, partial [Cerasibacillus quisquiliarum]
MVKKEGKSFWKSRIGGQVKRVTSLTMAATIALSMSTVANVVSKVSPGDSLAVPVVHAQGQNMMNVDEILTNFHINHNDEYEHWTHKLQNDGDISLDGPEFDLTDVTYVVKFPNELAHLLDDNYVIDYLTGKMTNFDYTMNPFNITGIVIDENGEEISIQKDRDKPYNYISINKATNSIEFDFKRFYDENNYEPYIRQSVSGEYFFNNLGFETPIIVPDSRMLKNGTYEFKTAIVRGKSVDLDQVSNAYSIDLVVDYSTDPDPEPEPEDPVVDKSELEALVDAAQGFDADDYTEESFAALTAALEDAQAVLNNEDATQEEVDVALA